MTRAQLRANVRSNLYDAGVTFYDDDAINQSLQDGYNEVAAKCRCITKSAAVQQLANQPYYDFLNVSGVTDYLGTVAIYNADTLFWLRDDVSIRDFDRIRRDWETWTGEPQFWAPHSQQYIAVCPVLAAVITGVNLFTLWYWAQAPSFAAQESPDSTAPLIATDMQPLLEWYATGDLLEDAQEVTKAQDWWQRFEADKIKYRERCINLAKAQLLLRV